MRVQQFITALILLVLMRLGIGQDTSPPVVSTTDFVTQEILEVKIQEVEAATDIEEPAKPKLIELYRKALSNLQAVSLNTRAAEDFSQAAETASVQAQTLREEIEKTSDSSSENTFEVDPSTPLRQIEQLLQNEKADFAALDARLSDLEKNLEEELSRSTPIRQRLIAANEEQENVATQLKLLASATEGSATTEARRWLLETGIDALRTEINMLDQELLGQPSRVNLLKAKRDKTSADIQWVGETDQIPGRNGQSQTPAGS